ncbi:DUF5682 family protein [Planctomycetaceae bacterium SH139]
MNCVKPSIAKLHSKSKETTVSETAAEHNPQAVIDSLAACQTPLLIGVRHHSAAIARVINTLLERFAPTTVLVELPSDFAPWLEYLADPETKAPVAISAVDANGSLGFYPLADFSPEFVAVRWAIKHGVPVIPCDLSVSARLTQNEPAETTSQSDTNTEFQNLLAALMRRTQANDTGQLWERLVESPAMTTDAEDVRKAGLTFGWAIRSSHAKIDSRDLLREAVMRQAIRDASNRCVAIVGAFHAPVLTATAIETHAAADAQVLQAMEWAPETVGVSLVPYGFEQLDERSGYPAGIRDPVWHQRMFAAENSPAMDAASVELVVDICRSMRKRGHVAGTPDATEVIRMMRDLANLRRLPAAGRSELIEAIETCLAHGELNGRAREIAKAAEPVLIGRRRGSVSPRTPRCGLALAIDELLGSFALPTSAEAKGSPREIRLDILRSPRDRVKAVNLRRLCVVGIPYAERVDTIATGERENLTERWQVGWKQGTSATIESVSRFGVTLPQAVAGALSHRYQQAQARLGEPSGEPLHPVQLLERLELAAECGLNELLVNDLASLTGMYLKTAGLSELTKALTLWGRIEAGHVAALPIDDANALPPYIPRFDTAPFANLAPQLLEATLQRLEGIAGSKDKQDIHGVSDLTHWFYDNRTRNAQRLIRWCDQTLQRGSDGMRGLSAGVLALFEKFDRPQLAELIGGWFDAATSKQGRQQLRGRLLGLTQVLFPHMVCDPSWLAGLENRLLAIGDDGFIQRLPALRGAFQEFSPADRQRLLRVRLELHSDRGLALRMDIADAQVVADAGLWAATLRDADLRGRARIHEVMPDFNFAIPQQVPTNLATDLPATTINLLDKRADHQIPIADRWRMILGVPPEKKSPATCAASRLDELYGHGKGEGARDAIGNRDSSPRGGGDQAPQPTLLEWSDDLEKLFGSDVCQEVVAEAIERGNVAAVNLLDPNRVTPSIDLLRQVLSLAGGLPEQRAEKLRKLAKRITAALAEQLAVRLQPALNGLASTRPTRRRSRKLYLRRTIHENLANVYRRQNGKPSVIAKRLVFHSTARREMDWHLTFVVDVSGSMTASVIYSAICAAVFAELPALSVSFLAFSTEVIDLSDKVVDPLSLLLEVQVGGGTRIGLGLAAARAKISVPQRTLLVLVSDFEEGVSVGEMMGEIRQLAESGVRCLGLAALDDAGVARFHQGYANLAASAGMSVAAVAPEQLARWVGDQIRGHASGASQPQPNGAV